MNVNRLHPWQGMLAAHRISRLPPRPETGDGNPWVVGRCWLWCGRESTHVLWIGTGSGSTGVTGDLFACAECAQALDDQILSVHLSKDIGGEELPGYTAVGALHPAGAHPPPSGRHRRRP